MSYIDDDFIGPEEQPRNGEIVTFYSFKGGVGRTMTLANCAFLAASSGQRVLVMDWDLEAPGLAYYFRGVQEPAVARELRSSPGVLNFLWTWVNLVRHNTKEAIEEATALFDSGAPFETSVRQLVANEFFQEFNGSIDYISAGSPTVTIPEPTHYEEALAAFPWPDFFTKMAGGYVSRSLREWAKQRYDLILIDSRTGLAESAGVCTMQLPDTVALCFVLNRQNIEGISKIASAIRSTRPDIRLLAAPMRVAREGTSEESEARAKAITDLTRLGGFSVEEATHQLQALAMRHADNVPFYESLAPIVATDLGTDPLCFNYLRFARELTGHEELALVTLDEGLLSRARARLQPQLATREYVEKLIGSEPLRAITELESLVSSAEELVANGELESLNEDYLQALISVSFEPRTRQFPERSFELQIRALNILRMLTEVDPRWGKSLAEALEQHLITNPGQIEDEDEIALREELDKFYSPSTQPVSEIKRLENRRRIAWLTYRAYDTVVTQDFAELFSRVSELRERETLGASASDELHFIQVDLHYLKACFALEEEADPATAFENLQAAVNLCSGIEWANARGDLKRTATDAYAMLATRTELDIPSEQRLAYAVEAARINGSGLSASMFFELFRVLVDASSVVKLSEFLDISLGSAYAQPRASTFALHFGRTPQAASRYLEVATKAVALLHEGDNSDHTNFILQRLAGIADVAVIQVSHRRFPFVRGRKSDVAQRYQEMVQALKAAGIAWTQTAELLQALEVLASVAPIKEK